MLGSGLKVQDLKMSRYGFEGLGARDLYGFESQDSGLRLRV